MRFIPSGERGGASGIFLSVLAWLAAAGLAGFLIWRYMGSAPRPPAPLFSQATPAIPGSFRGDPAEATDKLLRALNQRLLDMDLLKLLAREVATSPATVQGKEFLTYQETFRSPSRYTPDQIAGRLEESAISLGAVMRAEGSPGSYSFGYGSDWAPVEIQFEPPAKFRVCLIIDDGGYQRGEALEHLYALKVPVTVAVIPDVEFSKSLAEEFPSHGVEVMCHMPMEGHEKGAVGGDYEELLVKGMGSEQVRSKVRKAIGDLPNCRGLNNHMGSVATTDPELIWDVCQVLKEKNLFIVDSRTTPESVVEPVASKAGVPVTRRDVFLDNVETPEAILRQVDRLVRLARRRGVAVGIGHFKTITLRTLEDAVRRLKEQGVQFVYASEVVKEE